MLGYVRQRIGLKLFLIFTGLLCGAISLVGLYHVLHSRNFNQKIIFQNEQYVKDQALQMLASVTAERARKVEATLQELSAYTALIAREVELRAQLAGHPGVESTQDAPQMAVNPQNGIFFNSPSAKLALAYWGGESIPAEVVRQISLLASLEPTLAQTRQSSPLIAASHLIMLSGAAAYYPNGENFLRLPPVSVFDIRTTNNVVMANPANNPQAKPLWVPVYFDDAGNGLVTSVTAPIYGADREFLGVAGLDLPIDSLRQYIVQQGGRDEVEEPQGEQLVILLDQNGKIISIPLDRLPQLGIKSQHGEFRTAADVFELGLVDSYLPEIRKLGEELLYTPELTTGLLLRGERYVVSASQLSANGWQLVTIVPEEVFLAPIRSITSALAADFSEIGGEFLLVSLLLLGTTLILTVLTLKRYFLTPVTEVTIAAQKIREGELAVRIELGRTDELGQLASSFNGMAESLQRGRILEQNYARELQGQVESQTAELEEKRGQLERALEVLQADIERRRQVEKELVVAKEAAEAANRAKANFLANMTHELRTPMIGVLGMNELLLESSLSEEQRRLATTVQQSGETLLALVNDILDFSKIESGKLQLSRQACRLSDVFESTRSLLEESALAKGLSLHWEIDPSAEACVFCDPQRFRQIVVNLAGNAIKFTLQGHIAVRFRMVRCGDGAGHFVLDVEDTGIGIKPEEQQRIFAPFVQVDNGTTRAFSGTGLGLSIVHELVEAMGGILTLESHPGSGSLFRVEFTLPLAAPEEEKDPLCGGAPVAMGQERMLSGRILVVDDYGPTHLLVREFLKGTGLVVDEASSAVEALQSVGERPYELVLMDCNMPETDGIEVTRRLRASGFGKTIVAMTAHVDSRILADCQAAGMDDYLGKPFRRKDLLNILAKHLSTTA